MHNFEDEVLATCARTLLNLAKFPAILSRMKTKDPTLDDPDRLPCTLDEDESTKKNGILVERDRYRFSAPFSGWYGKDARSTRFPSKRLLIGQFDHVLIQRGMWLEEGIHVAV